MSYEQVHQYEPQDGKHINEAKCSICIHSQWHHCPPTLGIQTSVTPSRGLLYHVCLPSTVIKGYLWWGNLFLTALEAEKSNIKVLARCQGPIAALTQDERWYEKERKRAGGREITHPFIANALDNPSLIHVRATASWAHSLLMALCLNTAALTAALNTCAPGDTPDTQQLCFLPSRDFHKPSQSPPRVTRTRGAEVCDALSLKRGKLTSYGWLAEVTWSLWGRRNAEKIHYSLTMAL